MSLCAVLLKLLTLLIACNVYSYGMVVLRLLNLVTLTHRLKYVAKLKAEVDFRVIQLPYGSRGCCSDFDRALSRLSNKDLLLGEIFFHYWNRYTV